MRSTLAPSLTCRFGSAKIGGWRCAFLELLNDCVADPFRGIGKPEPLKRNLRGLWSRRITVEHRLVYRVTDERILVMQCRYHYE